MEGRIWAEAKSMETVVEIWHSILTTNAEILDPEADVLVLRQCLELSHARWWVSASDSILHILQEIGHRFENRLSKETKELCREPLPCISRFHRTLHDDTLSDERMDANWKDRFVQTFQKRVGIQLEAVKKQYEEGRILVARKTISNALGNARGLYESHWKEQSGKDVIKESRNYVTGRAWLAQALYVSCLLWSADLSLELQEIGMGKLAIEEAAKLNEAIKSRSLESAIETFLARFALSERNLNLARASIRRASSLFSDENGWTRFSNSGTVFSGNLLSRMMDLERLFESNSGATRFRSETVLENLKTISTSDLAAKRTQICLQLSSLVAARKLTFSDSLALMVEYLKTTPNGEASKIDLYSFLLSAVRWNDDLRMSTGSNGRLFGVENLEERFRKSLDLQDRSQSSFRDLSGLALSITDAIVRSIAEVLSLGLETSCPGKGLAEIKIRLLLIIWNGCREAPTLFEEASFLLGFLLGRSNQLAASAYFFMCTHGNGFRLQTRYNMEKKLESDPDREALFLSLSIPSLEMTMHRDFLKCLDEKCESKLNDIVRSSNPNTCLVSVDVFSKSCIWPRSDEDILVLTRFHSRRIPLVVCIPSRFHSCGTEQTNDASERTPDEPTTFLDVLRVMEDLLDENLRDFKRTNNDVELDKTEIEQWWKRRIEMDKKLGRLVQSVDAWLGPWKLLLNGTHPSDAEIDLTKQFLHETFDVFADSSSSVALEMIATIFKGRKALSHGSERVVDVLHMLLGESVSKEPIRRIWKTLLVNREEHASVKGFMTVQPKRGRIRRMRSTLRIQPEEESSLLSPLPSPEIREMFKPIASFGPRDDLFETPQKKHSPEERVDAFVTELQQLQSEEESAVPISLILDFCLAEFPWESLPCCSDRSFYRVLNVHHVLYLNHIQRRRNSFPSNASLNVSGWMFQQMVPSSEI